MSERIHTSTEKKNIKTDVRLRERKEINARRTKNDNKLQKNNEEEKKPLSTNRELNDSKGHIFYLAGVCVYACGNSHDNS